MWLKWPFFPLGFRFSGEGGWGGLGGFSFFESLMFMDFVKSWNWTKDNQKKTDFSNSSLEFSTQHDFPESGDINCSRRVFFPEPDPLRELSFDEIQLFEIRKNMKNVKSGN